MANIVRNEQTGNRAKLHQTHVLTGHDSCCATATLAVGTHRHRAVTGCGGTCMVPVALERASWRFVDCSRLLRLYRVSNSSWDEHILVARVYRHFVRQTIDRQQRLFDLRRSCSSDRRGYMRYVMYIQGDPHRAATAKNHAKQ